MPAAARLPSHACGRAVAPAVRRRGGLAGTGRSLLATVALAAAAQAAATPPAASQAAPQADVAQLQAAAQRLGGTAAAAWPALHALLQSVASARPAAADDEHARLEAVNRFFNRHVRWRSDAELWGQDDFWATPLQLLARGAGDCEDYAVAKYAALRAAGVPAERLRLVYVEAITAPGAAVPALVAETGAATTVVAAPATAATGIGAPAGATVAHMVLAYQGAAGAEPLILDNLRDDIVPAAARADLVPVFSFNHAGLWRGVSGEPAGDPLRRLPRWRELLERLSAEGW
jgi:predicted transglutaminase-like cysteine proteinase